MVDASGSIAAAAAAADTAAAEAGFAGEVAVFGHCFLERVAVAGHDGFGEVAAFIGFDAGELFRATGERDETGGEAEGENGFHRE